MYMGHTIGCGSWDGGACDCQPKEPTPVVGMGATYSIGSDMYPCTVIAVMRNGRTIRLSHDTIKGRGKLFVPNMNPVDECEVIVATLRSDGRYMERGTNYGFIRLGKRRNYHDPSF